MVPVVNKITIGCVKDIFKKKTTQINPKNIEGMNITIGAQKVFIGGPIIKTKSQNK